jgi:hypothetical protein
VAYLLEICEEVQVLVVDGSLLVLGDVLEVDDAFGWLFELNAFPLGVVGEDGALHYNTD